MLGIGFKGDEMNTYIFDMESIYNKIINKLFFVKRAEGPSFYIYTKPGHSYRLNNENKHERAISYMLIDKNFMLLDANHGHMMRAVLAEAAPHKDDLFCETSDAVFAKMLLIHGDKI